MNDFKKHYFWCAISSLNADSYCDCDDGLVDVVDDDCDYDGDHLLGLPVWSIAVDKESHRKTKVFKQHLPPAPPLIDFKK